MILVPLFQLNPDYIQHVCHDALPRLTLYREIMKPSLVVLLMIMFVGCAEHREDASNKAYYFRSKNELNATEREALAGDNAAAKRMADYYYFAKNDRGNAIWWLKLGASRGDQTAKQDLKKLEQE
jgi:hypothetical protein